MYQFFPVRNGQFQFKVRAANDAHLALVNVPVEAEPLLEVMIGGWGNSKSVIRKNKQQPEKAEAATPSILSAGEFRGFWIRWADNVSGVLFGNEFDDFLVNVYGHCPPTMR